MANTSVEISVSGKWVSVPAVDVDGNTIAIAGKWLKYAVVPEEDYAETEISSPGRYVEVLKAQKQRRLRADVLTFAQKPPVTTPTYSYLMEWDSVAVVRTSSFNEWWEQLPQESRKNVRRGQKRGVTMVVKQVDDDLISDIRELNNDSPVRQGRAFVHYGKTLEQVRKDQASFPGRSDYVCAYLGTELIGFLKIAYRRDIASVVQILPKASHHDKRPANLLVARAVELCESKGITHLTYGLFNYGNRHDTPLRQFKVRNGFEEMLIPRYYVPLTLWGRFCTKLRLHRGLIGILPDRIIQFGANTRAKWNDISQLVRRPV